MDLRISGTDNNIVAKFTWYVVYLSLLFCFVIEQSVLSKLIITAKL